MAEYGSIRQRWTRTVSSSSSNENGIVPTDRSAPESITAPAQQIPNLSPEPARDPSLEPPTRASSNGTFIGNGALFEGTLTLRGDFRIDTEFRGELETDGMIIIESRGSVVGRIRAREVLVRGAVVGDVTAPRQIVIESTGKLHGDIETACLEIQKHALFRGNSSMSQPQSAHRANASAPKASQAAQANA